MGQAVGKQQLGARETSYSGPGDLFAAAVDEFSVFVLRTDVADEKTRADIYESKLKVVRSPDILRFKKAINVPPDKRWLITERVVPLESMKEALSYAQLVLAMHRVVRGLHFMHTQCKLSHNSVCLAAVFVHYEPGGDMNPSFRLGGLHACDTVPCTGSFLSPYPEPPEGPVPRAKAQALPIHSRDVWHLGFLLQQLLESSEARAAAVNAVCLLCDAFPCLVIAVPTSIIGMFSASSANLLCLSDVLLSTSSAKPCATPSPHCGPRAQRYCNTPSSNATCAFAS
jgi:hypothetical protein